MNFEEKVLQPRYYSKEQRLYLAQLTNASTALKDFCNYYQSQNLRVFYFGFYARATAYDRYRSYIRKINHFIKTKELNVTYYGIIEADEEHRLHSHGALYSSHRRSTLERILNPKWIDIAGEGANFHVEKMFDIDGWIRYCTRITKRSCTGKMYDAKGTSTTKIKSLPVKYNLDTELKRIMRTSKPTLNSGFKKTLESLSSIWPEALNYYRDLAA